MTRSIDYASLYDEHYFRTYGGQPYERNPMWLGLFGAMADNIVRTINPRRVLDAGCSLGLLVEALRDRGVDASGLDLSSYAIDQVRPDIRAHCWVGTLTDPLPGRYDLVVCQEVLEHLPPADAPVAIANICAVTDDVLFSSPADVYAEDTHINVRPPEYWASLFAGRGFVRDVDFEEPVLPAPWAVRFRRTTEPWPRLVERYERRLARTSAEVAALRTRALETKTLLAAKDTALAERPDAHVLEQTVADQQEHLTALSRRCEYLSDREAELRSLLHDAHEQLLERDRGGPAGTAETIADLYTVIGERTQWAERMVAEAEKRLEIVNQQQAVIDGLERERAVRAALDTELFGDSDPRQTLDELRATVSRLSSDAAEHRRDAAARRTEVATLHADATTLRTEVGVLRDHVRAMEASRAWRMASQLRAVRRRLGL